MLACSVNGVGYQRLFLDETNIVDGQEHPYSWLPNMGLDVIFITHCENHETFVSLSSRRFSI